jgi:LysM repeat protein
MTYNVKPGDTLSKIAARNGLTLAQLLQSNPQIKDPNRIKVGDPINLPEGASGVPEGSTENTQPLPSVMKPITAAAGALGAALADALGALSAKYETGGRGCGTVSTGAGDYGGVSYGSYQMASKMGVPTKFVCQPGFPWAKDFANLTAGTAPFTTVWKRIAADQPDEFQKAQHSYIKKTHYDLLVAKILSDSGLDVNTRSRALQDVVWSTAVQHGPGTPIVSRACSSLTCKTSDANYDELLIRAIYAERGRRKADGNLAYFSKSSASVQQGVANRFKSELQDALKMLAKESYQS